MTEYYNREQLRQFFTTDAEMETASEAEQYAASARLLALVFRTMRQRYPEAAPVLDACESATHPLGDLWRDATWETRTKDVMVELGLLLPLPPQVRDAILACVACDDGQIASIQDVLCPRCKAQQGQSPQSAETFHDDEEHV